MATQQTTDSELEATIEKIGGIDSLDLTIPPGVTVLAGDNATNRSSALQGIMAALGSNRDTISVKAGHETGHAEVTIGADTYTQEVRQRDKPAAAASSYAIDELTIADQYAFLTRDNPIRRAVEAEKSLYEPLMAAVDVDEIKQHKDRLSERRRELKEEINDAEAAADELPKLEEEKTKLETRLDELREKEAKIEEEQERVREQASPEKRQQLDDIEEKIKKKETNLNKLEREITRKKNSLEDQQEKYENLDIPDIDIEQAQQELEELEAERETARERIRELQTVKKDVADAEKAARGLLNTEQSLQTAIRRLPADLDIPTSPIDLRRGESAASITQELTGDQARYCTACGTETDVERVEEIVDQYTSVKETIGDEIDRLRHRQNTIQADIETIEDDIDARKDAIDEEASLKTKIKNSEEELEQLEAEKETKEAELDDLAQQKVEINEQITDTEDVEEVQRDLSKIRSRIRQVNSDLDDISEKIEAKEAEASREASLKEKKEAVEDEYEEYAGRKKQIERELAGQFNEKIADIISLLSYNNISRVWIERREINDETHFELNVVRETPNGHQDVTLGQLSESERAVVGLAVALTGYLVHDVKDNCPVVLLDSIEMIDATRIKELLRFFSDHATYVIGVLLSEDAAEMPADEFAIITP